MDDEGLKLKYTVTHADGRPCNHFKFVLSPEVDPAARVALAAYAEATKNERLRADSSIIHAG